MAVRVEDWGIGKQGLGVGRVRLRRWGEIMTGTVMPLGGGVADGYFNLNSKLKLALSAARR